jgi:hypothetical protein
MKRTAKLVAYPLVAAIACRASDVRATVPVDVEIATKTGFATNPTTTGPNPMGFGLGGRLGVSIAGLYAGASAVYFFGGTAGTGMDSEQENSVEYGAEIGYGVKISRFTIRGVLGIGNFQQLGNGVATGGENNLYVEPGVLAMCSFGAFFLGADVNAFFLPSSPGNTNAALTFHGQLGVSF